MRRIIGLDIDTWGATASLLCAIHCALVPLILSFGMLTGVSFLADPLWDMVFIGIALALASISLYNGYRKHHGRLYPITLALFGFLSIALGHLILHDWLFGHALSVLGGLLVAAAHLSNYRACNACRICRH